MEPTDREQYCLSHYLEFQTLEKAKEIYQQLTDTLLEFYGQEFSPHLEKLRLMLDPIYLKGNPETNPIGTLKSIASGLVQNLCQRNSFGTYSTSKVNRIYIHPGSLFYSRRPEWIIAAEIIETTKLFARNVTEVDPAWFQNNVPHKKSKKKRAQDRHKRRRFR